MRTSFVLCGAAGIALLATAACDFEKTGNQLQAQKVMVATVLGTPPVQISPLALAGFDGGFDAGSLEGLDGGAYFDSDAGMVTLPPQTAAFVFFGERQKQSLDTPPDPITGAQVAVAAVGDPPVVLEEVGSGNYQLTSQDNPELKYQSGATYEFRVEHEGALYVGKVEQAPQLEEIPAFHPPSGYIDHPAAASFTFNRPPAPEGQERNIGFVTVFPVDEQGERGDPTYTNIPTTPLQFLELVALPSRWRQTTVTVPGTAFPQPDMTYVLVLQAVKLGDPESENLFTGSAILAGTAEVAVFRTK